MAATFTASAVFKAIDKISAPMRTMTKASKTFAQKTELAFARVERRMRRLRKSVGTLGLAIGGALIIGAVTSVIGVFADFEQANANLSSVMATATVPQLKALNLDAQRLGSTTAKTASEVVGLQEAFARLGFETPDIIKMTEATISGSIAMKGELADTAELVGAMVKSFDDFSSANAPGIIDKLTASTQKSALNFEKLQTSLPIVAGAANAAKVPFTRLLSSLGKLSDAGIDASSSSTALRNIFLEAAKRGVPYQKLLDKVSQSTDKLATANELFGKRGAVAAVILAKNTAQVNALDKALQNTAGTAAIAAAKQLDTLNGRLTIMKSAWEGFILSIENGNGAFSNFLKTSIQVITELLSMASGTAKATENMTAAQLQIRKVAEKVIFAGKAIGILIGSMVALKAAMLVNRAIMATMGFLKFVRVIMLIAKAKGVWTAVQWALNAAMAANPLGLIIIAVAALIAGVVLLVQNWSKMVEWVKTSDNWFAKLIRASIYPLIIGFKAIRFAIGFVVDKFKQLTSWIKTSDSGFAKFLRFGLGALIKAFEILGVVLEKVGGFFEKIWGWIKKMAGGAIDPILKIIDAFSKGTQKELGLNVINDNKTIYPNIDFENNKPPLQTTSEVAAQESIKREERITKQNVDVNINNKTDFDISVDALSSFPVVVKETN